MNWIKIEEIEKHNPDGNILVWQKNLSDESCSRFQRATYFSEIVQIYPATNRMYYQKKNDYKNHDLEGDMCQITHFALVEAPPF